MPWKKLPDNTIRHNPDRYLGRKVKQGNREWGDVQEGILVRKVDGENRTLEFGIVLANGDTRWGYGGENAWFVWETSPLYFLKQHEEKLLEPSGETAA